MINRIVRNPNMIKRKILSVATSVDSLQSAEEPVAGLGTEFSDKGTCHGGRT